MSKKLLFNFKRQTAQKYNYIKYVGTDLTVVNTLEKPIKNAILKGQTVVLPSKNTRAVNDVITEAWLNESTGAIGTKSGEFATVEKLPLPPVPCVLKGTSLNNKNKIKIAFYDSNDKFIESLTKKGNQPLSITTLKSNYCYCRYGYSSTNRDNGFGIYDNMGVLIENYPPSPSDPVESVEAPSVALYGSYGSYTVSTPIDLVLRSSDSVYDELDLNTGELTQRISEDGEVLGQSVVKAISLTIVNQDGVQVDSFTSFDDTTRIVTSSNTVIPTFEGYLAIKEVG